MIRAVAIDAGLMGGPNHGIFSPSGTLRSAASSATRPSRQIARSSSGGSIAISSAPSST
jgi:hypothetical protein